MHIRPCVPSTEEKEHAGNGAEPGSLVGPADSLSQTGKETTALESSPRLWVLGCKPEARGLFPKHALMMMMMMLQSRAHLAGEGTAAGALAEPAGLLSEMGLGGFAASRAASAPLGSCSQQAMWVQRQSVTMPSL